MSTNIDINEMTLAELKAIQSAIVEKQQSEISSIKSKIANAIDLSEYNNYIIKIADGIIDVKPKTAGSGSTKNTVVEITWQDGEVETFTNKTELVNLLFENYICMKENISFIRELSNSNLYAKYTSNKALSKLLQYHANDAAQGYSKAVIKENDVVVSTITINWQIES